MTRAIRRQALAAFLAVASAAVVGASDASGATPGVIVFAADRAPTLSNEIYRVRFSDGRRINLSRSPYRDYEPLISPDGKQVAFLSDRNGRSQVLYVVRADGSRLRRAASLHPLRSVSWAPDGKRLVAAWGSRADGGVYVVQPGRRPRLITRSPLGQPAWSPDGRFITVRSVRRRGRNFVEAFSERGRPAWRVRAEGPASWSAKNHLAVEGVDGIRVYGERGLLLSRFAGRAFAWSQTGKRLAIVVGDRLELRRGDGRSVVLRTKVPGLEMSQFNGIEWVSRSRIIVWGVSGRGFVGFDISTRRTWPVRYGDTYSADGALVLHPRRIGEKFALQVSKVTERSPRTLADVPGCFDDGVFRAAVEYVQFVPDAKSLVYQSDCREPFHNLYAVRSDGTGLRRLTRINEEERFPQVSPDGSRIAYSRSDYRELSCKGCPATIWVRDVDGSHPRQLTPTRRDTWDDIRAWFPDGSKIAFSRAHPSSAGLFVVPSNGGRARKLHVHGQLRWGSDWSRDGRRAFLEVDDHVVIEIGAQRTVRLPLAQADSVAWSPDGRSLVLTARATSTSPSDVYTVDLDGRNLKRLTWNLNASGASWRP